MRDGDGKLVTYGPYFDAAATSYTALARTTVTRLTIQPTATNEDGASVVYLNGENEVLTDADTVKDGFQIDLEVGENTINVKVTAEDGTTTRTYTMVVTREESRVAADALVSNLDEPFNKRLYIGNLEPGKTLRTQALGFETGDNASGYVLNSVKILIWEVTHSAGVRVRIFTSTAEGAPDSSLYTLSGSDTAGITSHEARPEDTIPTTFEAPADAILEKNTHYFVVLDSRATKLYRFYKVFGTKSETVSKVAMGWRMNTDRHTGIRDSGVWTIVSEVPFVEISGDAFVPSSDATLEGLELTWDDGRTTTAIALDPIFDAATTSYTVSVASDVDQLTINAKKKDGGASVLYLDSTDTAFMDADMNAPGLQIDLNVGANTIKTQVTAQDDETIQTYTVVVTRIADVTAPSASNATVNGDTLVIAFNEALAAAGNMANSAFVVKKTPSGGSEKTVTLTGTPSISGSFVTLTLVTGVSASDSDVTVSYTKPTTGMDNKLTDLSGNEVADIEDLAVSNQTTAAPPDVPAAPTLTVGTAWVEASWMAPTDNGSAITDYDVQYRQTNGNWLEADHSGTGTTKRIASLSPDTAYDVRVRATNTEGSSDWSSSASVRTDADVPDAPSAPTLTAGTTWLEASWTAPANNGSAVTDYDVQYRETNGNWQTLDHTGTSTTKRIESLTADTAYEVRVRATNAEGTSDWSSSASVRTDDAPSAPTLTAGATWLEASWTAPANNGSAITDYDVQYRETNGTGRPSTIPVPTPRSGSKA